MNEWPDSIPSYLHNTPMGDQMLKKQRITLPITKEQMMEIYKMPGVAGAYTDPSLLLSALDTGAKIKAKRTDLGMSQAEVAKALDCTPAYISQIEAKESIDRKTDLAFRAIFAAKQASKE